MSNEERSFRLVSVPQDSGNVDFEDGVYHGKRPNQAALKAFNWYCRKADLKTCQGRFNLQEITPGSNHKVYHYVGIRQKLKSPKLIDRGGSSYYVYHKTSVHRAE